MSHLEEIRALDRIAARFDATHDFTFKDHCVMLCQVGSHSHGTHIPPENGGIDDVDYLAVVLPPARYLVSLSIFEGWNDQWEELDVVVYSFHKFVKLLIKSNPNVLGTLWLRNEDFVLRTRLWYQLLGIRSQFATKAAYQSFAGYAQGQMKDMTAYSPEIQAEIEALEHNMSIYGWSVQDVMDRRSVRMPFFVTPEVANRQADRLRYLRAKYHSAYMGEKRRSLVKRHGYDTKNAAHLLRLLRMCEEFLYGGQMQVYRGDIDARFLKDVKRGAYSLEQVKTWAEQQFAACERARAGSQLPEKPDVEAISQWLADTVLHYIQLT